MTPYDNLPAKAFWRLAIANRSMFDIDELWDPKFDIKPDDSVATFGSCFAQHIGRALHSRGFKWLISEPAPEDCPSELAAEFNYGIFTARTGNIYTTSLLNQWVEWAAGITKVPDEVWEKDGRFFDPFRPRIEPNGFESVDELYKSREETLIALESSIKSSRYFVFTLGLTESWISEAGGYEYPMCPGTVAGKFDPEKHKFLNLSYGDVKRSLLKAINTMQGMNPELKFILTVSPVPLTATNSGRHIAVATMASKSILRAVADQISTNRDSIDYFPSYEIINSPIFKGAFFEPNQRSVNSYGVNFVMDSFFNGLESKYGTNVKKKRELASKRKPATPISQADEIDPTCDEMLLDTFAPGRDS
jgi:hypothetical protein